MMDHNVFVKFFLVSLVIKIIFLFNFGPQLSVSGQRIIDPKLLRSSANIDLDEFWNNRSEILKNDLHNNFEKILEYWNNCIERDRLRDKVHSRCLNLVDYILKNPLQHEWIVKMFDSGFKLPVGLLSGTMTNLGDFDQCIGISDSHKDESFFGKYCLATINLPRADQFRHPIPLNRSDWIANHIQRWYENDNYHSLATAVCFPSICTESDVREMLLSYYRDYLKSVEFDVKYCQSNDEPQNYRTGIYVAIAILALPWLLIIPATLIDLWNGGSSSHQSTPFRIMACFSIVSNNRFLFQIKSKEEDKTATTGKNGQEFQFIHGIRAIGALIIAISHAGGLCTVQMYSPISLVSRNPGDMISMSGKFLAQPFYNASTIVWTFFLISGFLLTYLNAVPKHPVKVGFFQYIFLRYLRFTPPLMAMISMNIVLELFGNGPLFHTDILWPLLRPCYQNWWMHITYINNLFDFTEMCNIQTWYLSTDMQLHIVAYLILVLYSRNRRSAYLACILLITIGMIGIVIPVSAGFVKIVSTHRIIYTKHPQPVDVARLVYFSSTLGLIPYFIGCALGLLMIENRIRFSRFQETLFWWFSILILISLPFSTYPTATDPEKISGDDTITNAIIFSLMVLLWSLANAWLLFQFAKNPRLTVGKFLSANFFKPLSRLSFSFYLTHLMTIWFSVHQIRSPLYMGSFIGMSKVICTTLIFSTVFAYLLHITFEAPTIGLMILFFKNKKTKQGTAAVVEIDKNNNENINEQKCLNNKKMKSNQ